MVAPTLNYISASDSAPQPKPSRHRPSFAVKRQSYEAVIQRILSDHEGKQTWNDLENLEKNATTNPSAGKAMARLEALNAAQEYTADSNRTKHAKHTATLIDGADLKTQQQAWSKVIDGTTRAEGLDCLRASGKEAGWDVLGLPPCFEKKVGPRSHLSIEQPEQVSRLLDGALKRRLSPASDDPRLKEYRRLYHAYQQVRSGKHHGKVRERALYLDLKSLEEKMLPEHLTKAKKQVRSQILGDSEFERLHPQSRVRRFLGTLSALPPASRERHLIRELSEVAVKEPRELKRYAGLVQDEIRRCPGRLKAELLPEFHRAIAQVGRTHGERLNLSNKNSQAVGDFRGLLEALTEHSVSREAPDADLELYRSGLTYNGSLKNYTV